LGRVARVGSKRTIWSVDALAQLPDEEVGGRADGAVSGRCAESAVGRADLTRAGLVVVVITVETGAEAEGFAAAEVESLATGRAVCCRNAL
jgi:hypothetical protein